MALTQALYDAALRYEASSDWVQAAETWKACVNETLRQTEECRVQCEVASQVLPEDRGVGTADGVFQKAAGKNRTTFLFTFFAEFTSRYCNPSPSSSGPFAARMPAVLCDSGGHEARKDFCSRGLSAHTAGTSAYCTV